MSPNFPVTISSRGHQLVVGAVDLDLEQMGYAVLEERAVYLALAAWMREAADYLENGELA